MELYESCNDAMTKSDVENVVMVFNNFEFLLGMFIWLKTLFAINSMSMSLQYKSICIDNALKQWELAEDNQQKINNWTYNHNI